VVFQGIIAAVTGDLAGTSKVLELFGYAAVAELLPVIFEIFSLV
jgi:hypothetical protein